MLHKMTKELVLSSWHCQICLNSSWACALILTWLSKENPALSNACLQDQFSWLPRINAFWCELPGISWVGGVWLCGFRGAAGGCAWAEESALLLCPRGLWFCDVCRGTRFPRNIFQPSGRSGRRYADSLFGGCSLTSCLWMPFLYHGWLNNELWVCGTANSSVVDFEAFSFFVLFWNFVFQSCSL